MAVRVIPRSSHTAVAGVRGDAILIRLAAPPVEGAANAALLAFVAGLFHRPKRDVRLISGHSGRDKRVAVAGVSEANVSACLDAALAGSSRRVRSPSR